MRITEQELRTQAVGNSNKDRNRKIESIRRIPVVRMTQRQAATAEQWSDK